MGISNTVQHHTTADLTELVGTQLFKQVSMAQVAALLRYCPTLTLSNGERLIVPGQTVDKIHLLLQGSLQVFDGEPSGTPVGTIRQGECVGLSSFVDHQPCHVSIVGDGICRLLVLDSERLMALLNTPTTVSRNLLFMLMTYLRGKAARAAEPAAPPAVIPEPSNHIDAVTGLHNQRWLEETLDRLILRAATDRAPLSLLAVDLIDHSGLTEEYGQEMLNMSLRAIAKTLRDSIRPTDLIARHAAGRFVIMLPGTDQENAVMAAARIQETVNSTEIVIPGVCILQPMKIVMGVTMMKAFVSGRKLVDDAFATLEQNRAIQLAAMAEPVIETTPEPESPVADISAMETVEPQSMAAAAETSFAALDNSTAELTAETLSEVVISGSGTPESVPEALPQDMFTDGSAIPSEEHPDDPSHLAA